MLEIYDLNKIYYLYDKFDTLNLNTKVKQFLIDVIDGNGELHVKYSTKPGRSFAQTQSIQLISSKVRNFLLADTDVVDIDISNSVISILYKEFELHDVECHTWSHYLNNRQEIIDTYYGGNKDLCKEFINKSCFTVATRIKTSNNFELGFKNDLHALQYYIGNLDEYEEIRAEAREKQDAKGKDNYLGCAMALIYHNYESQILELAISKYEADSNNKVMVKMFDGFLAKQTTNYDLEELNKYILEETDIKVTFVYKPLLNDIIPNIPANYVCDKEKIQDNLMLDKVEKIKDYDQLSNYTLSTVFLKLYGKNYLFNNDKYYYYNGHTWDMEQKPFRLKKDILDKLLYIYDKLKIRNITSNADDKMELVINLNKIYVNLKRTFTMVKDITEFVILNIKDDTIEFDVKLPYVICFKNLAIDVRTGAEVKPSYSDYCSFTTGYDYIKPTESNMNTISEIIDSIFPNPEIKKTYLSILWSGLTAIRQERFFMANGAGRNGKGMLNELMLKTLGPSYAYTGHITTLTKEMKSGPNPEVAQLNKKRFVKWEEPNDNDLLNLGNIKKITGEGKLNSRECNSNNTECHLYLSAVFECNKKPNLNGTIEPAIVDRFVDVLFESHFTNNQDELNSNPAARPINLELKQTTFQETMRCSLFDYLILNASKELYIAEIVKTRTRNYLLDNDDIYAWLIENYTPCVEDNPVTIKELLKHYKSSDNYNNLTKNCKKTLTEKYFKHRIETHLELKSYYKDRYQSHGLSLRSVVLNWKKINLEQEVLFYDELG
jgi:phage/plasmid-associated DNA primase